MKKNRAILTALSLLAVAVLGGILYVTVDHYAGGESQAATVQTVPAAGAEATETTAEPDAGTDAFGSEDATAGETTATAAGETEDSGAAGYAATDSSYTSSTLSISISEVVTGSGDDTVTYYVADVQVATGTILQAGLATGTHDTADTSDIAESCAAVLAINGDYYGARNDGIIIRNGEIIRDDGVRTGLALYQDGHMEVFDETETSAEELLAAGVWNTYSFGPALLVDGTIPDDVSSYEVEQNPKHPIQGRDPRTAIGMIDTNHFVFVVVDGRDAGYSKGVTLEELAQIMRSLGCTTAYNLDGGGSSTMWFMGELVNRPSGKSGERDISDILFVS
jgi:exopolysaccharide biosynthesis protein